TTGDAPPIPGAAGAGREASQGDDAGLATAES
ncbi:hypothetical protein A2U01_0093599, partial [Trifolium medium]|nr:hypothetical protein [Trifolium medium]